MNAYQTTSLNSATAVEVPKPMREMPQEIGRLHFEVEQLEGAIGRLASQLQPILKPVPSPSNKVADKEAPPVTKMAGEIQILSQRIRGVQLAINALSDDVQL